MIHVNCPACSSAGRINPDWMDNRIKCRQCGADFIPYICPACDNLGTVRSKRLGDSIRCLNCDELIEKFPVEVDKKPATHGKQKTPSQGEFRCQPTDRKKIAKVSVDSIKPSLHKANFLSKHSPEASPRNDKSPAYPYSHVAANRDSGWGRAMVLLSLYLVSMALFLYPPWTTERTATLEFPGQFADSKFKSVFSEKKPPRLVTYPFGLIGVFQEDINYMLLFSLQLIVWTVSFVICTTWTFDGTSNMADLISGFVQVMGNVFYLTFIFGCCIFVYSDSGVSGLFLYLLIVHLIALIWLAVALCLG